MHLDGILTRLTFVCALYLLVLALLPEVMVALGVAPIYPGGATALSA